MKPSEALEHNRELIKSIVKRRRGANPRVYGSVARGEDTESSDLDILIDTLPDTDLFDMGGMHTDLENALHVKVDVKTLHELPEKLRNRVLQEAKEI